jgi:hypothetical protein
MVGSVVGEGGTAVSVGTKATDDNVGRAGGSDEAPEITYVSQTTGKINNPAKIKKIVPKMMPRLEFTILNL